jgi:GxxExxY protein
MPLSYPELNPLTELIIGCAMKVHRHFGPGLLESVYEDALESDLLIANLSLERQREVPVPYNGILISTKFKPDLVVNGSVIVEVKSVEKLIPIHAAQVLTYLKITGIHVGLLINFNTIILKDGIKRISN